MKTAEIYQDTRQTARCRACNAPIIFAENVATQRRMPFDAPLIALQTRVAAARVIEEVDLGTTHFATCPQADRFRRTR